MAPMASSKKSLYEILGIAPDANDIDIALAYERRKQELQRSVPSDPSALSLVHQAHEILSNKKRREAYDASVVTQAEKAAAAEQAQSPDLVLETDDEDEAKPRKNLVIAAIAGVVVLAVVLFFVLKPGRETRVVEAPPPPPAPKPEPPPPPKPMGAHQILPAALLSVGQVNSYDMSGRAVPIGLALAVESGAVVTTCHGIPAGSKLVVRIGAETNSADLTTTDEVLDLCRLQVPGLNVRALTVAPDEAKPNEKVFVLGANPKGDFALTEGTVKAVRTLGEVRMLEISVPVAPGASGGAVLNEYGQLVGIADTQQNAIAASQVARMRSRAKAAPAEAPKPQS
jgi:S1-C subfamily serine protease